LPAMFTPCDVHEQQFTTYLRETGYSDVFIRRKNVINYGVD